MAGGSADLPATVLLLLASHSDRLKLQTVRSTLKPLFPTLSFLLLLIPLLSQVDQLTQQLREKADWCSELLLASEQLQREVGERNEEIDKLEGRIRELEQALLASTETVREKSDMGGEEGGMDDEGTRLRAQHRESAGDNARRDKSR